MARRWISERGETVALVGPSGAGKSTLLHVAGLLERPDVGEITMSGVTCSKLTDNRRTELRRVMIGFRLSVPSSIARILCFGKCRCSANDCFSVKIGCRGAGARAS